jgi:hypothetical protein
MRRQMSSPFRRLIAALGHGRATRRVRMALGLGVAIGTAAIFTLPAASAVPLACNPQVHNWTFESSNNYAAPSPGQRYSKTADGCQSVWYVGSSTTVTLSVQISNCPGGSGPCDTPPVTCTPNTVCELWDPATNDDNFYVFETTNKHVASGTIKF